MMHTVYQRTILVFKKQNATALHVLTALWNLSHWNDISCYKIW